MICVLVQEWPIPSNQYDENGMHYKRTELERRQSFVSKIDTGNFLLPYIKKCLLEDPKKRPDMSWLSKTLQQFLAQHPQSTKGRLDLLWENEAVRTELNALQKQLETKEVELSSLQTQVSLLRKQNKESDEELVATQKRIASLSTEKDARQGELAALGLQVETLQLQTRMEQEAAVPPIKQLADGATVDALLHKMKKKIMHTYILGQIGPLVTDPGTSNEEVTAEMTRAALPVGTKAKADFCQGIEHILLQLSQMNEKSKRAIVDPQTIQKVMERLNKKAACICVAGRYNAGKSMLINALLGSRILPSSRDAETAVTVYVTMPAANNGTEGVAGPPHLYSWPVNSTEKLICSGADAINKYLQKENLHLRSQSGTQEREFVVKVAIPMFSEFPDLGKGVTPYLVDLPGSNEVCQGKLANVAKLNVETATSFLYVMPYNELRNEQDYDAIKAIYSRDRQVFDDGRLIIVVTQYDISCDVSKQSQFSVEDVQETVAGMISKVLNLLTPLSREFIIPVSGLWAFWARLYKFSEGSMHRTDVMMSLIMLSRNATAEKVNEVFSLSHGKNYMHMYSKLEEASRIVALEEQMIKVMRSVISVWKRGIVKTCEAFIHSATMILDEMYQGAKQKYTEVDQCLKEAAYFYNLHQKIIDTVQEGSVVLNELRECYNEDTKPGDKLGILIGEVVSKFMQQKKSENKEMNYLSDDHEVQKDVRDDLQVDPEKEMQAFFEKEMQALFHCVKYNKCNKALQRAINKTANDCGLLRIAITFFSNRDQKSLSTLPEEHASEETLDDDLDSSIEIFEDVYVPPIEMTSGTQIKLVINVDEDWTVLEASLRCELQAHYIAHFEEIKEQVILYFFKIYCQDIEDNLDEFYRHLNAVDVVSLISDYKEKKDFLSRELAELEHRRKQILPNFTDCLKLLGS